MWKSPWRFASGQKKLPFAEAIGALTSLAALQEPGRNFQLEYSTQYLLAVAHYGAGNYEESKRRASDALLIARLHLNTNEAAGCEALFLRSSYACEPSD